MKNSTIYILSLLILIGLACSNCADTTKEAHVQANEISPDEMVLLTANNQEAGEYTIAAAPKSLLPDQQAEKNGLNQENTEATVLIADDNALPAIQVLEEYKPEDSVDLNEPDKASKESIETGMSVSLAVEMDKNDAPPSHAIWDGLLKSHVSSGGRVNYSGFVKNKAKLQEYLDLLSGNPPQDSWSRVEKLAFWINVYNAFTVKMIVDNDPVSSITKLHGGKPWNVKFIKIGSTTYSLDNIENNIIRPKFNEPRIHFALNCAAKSCPPLLNQAWTAGNLHRNFEQQTKAFINNPQHNKITADAISISKIFDWYKADFGQLIEFLNKYSDIKINENATVSYMEYDWALNK